MTKTEFVKALGFTTENSCWIDDIEDIGPAAEASGVTFAMAAAGQSCHFAILWREHVIYLEDYSGEASVSTTSSIGVTNDTIEALGKKIVEGMAQASDSDQTELAAVLYDKKADEAVETKLCSFFYSSAVMWLASGEAKALYDQMIESAERGGHSQDESAGMSLKQMGDTVSDKILELTFED